MKIRLGLLIIGLIFVGVKELVYAQCPQVCDDTNTSLGFDALLSTTGTGNVAVGASAMGFGTSGDYNTAIGDIAMRSNSSGTNNTACGAGALYGNNSTGSNNTAV